MKGRSYLCSRLPGVSCHVLDVGLMAACDTLYRCPQSQGPHTAAGACRCKCSCPSRTAAVTQPVRGIRGRGTWAEGALLFVCAPGSWDRRDVDG